MISPEEKVSEFVRAFGASLDPRLWVVLMKEEIDEFEKELTPDGDKVNLLKEAADVMYVSTMFHLLMETGENLYRFLLSDEEWDDWTLTAIEANNALKKAVMVFGAELLGQAFVRVHESNMSKLDDNGNPIVRKDGKILKGPNYKPPFLDDLVQ